MNNKCVVDEDTVSRALDEVMFEKYEEFIENYHQDRMNELKLKYPRHYAPMTKEELESSEKKERKIVKTFFEDNQPYTHQMSNTDTMIVDGIPDVSIGVILDYSVQLFKDCLISFQDLKERMDTIYELTAEYISLITLGIDYKYTCKEHYNHFNEDKPQRRLEALRKKIIELKQIAEVDIIDSPHHNKLKEALEDLYNEPERYFTKKYNLLTPSLLESYRQPLLEYLKTLELKKGQKINVFMKELTQSILAIYD